MRPLLAFMVSCCLSSAAFAEETPTHPGKCGPLLEGALSLVQAAMPQKDKMASANTLWIKQRAEHGSAADKAGLGGLYFLGLNVPKDEDEGLKLLTESAQQGCLPAQNLLAILYKTCNGLRDDTLAAKWTKRAAEQGDPIAASHIAQYYHAGAGGMKQDDIEAEKWLLLYANPVPDASAFLERKLVEMNLTDADMAEAKKRAAAWTPTHEMASFQRGCGLAHEKSGAAKPATESGTTGRN